MSVVKLLPKRFTWLAHAIERIIEYSKRFVWVFPPVIVLVAMLCVFKASGLYPYGDKTVSWCDMDQQVVPLLLTFKDILAGKESFFYNTNNAGGMNFFGVFFFFLSSPFTFLVAFVDKGDMSLFANVLVVLKMCCIAATSSFYLYTRNKNAPVLNVALSVLNAISGYVMMYYQNVVWLDMVYVFPLLLLGLDRLKQGKRGLFIGVLTSCLFINYYLSYMIVVFLLLYALVWAILSKDVRFTRDFILSCAVAALLSAVVWLPSFVQYFSSGRKTSVLQGLKDSSILTAYDTAVPTVFSVLFLLPVVLLPTKCEDRRAILYRILLVATLIPVVFEPINKMWQTGSYMSFPTRYAFITIFVCIVGAFERLSQNEKQVQEVPDNMRFSGLFVSYLKKNYPAIIISVGACALCVWYCFFSSDYTVANLDVMNAYAGTLWGNDASFEALLKLYVLALIIGGVIYLLYHFKLFRPALLAVAVCAMVISEFAISPPVYMVSPSQEVKGFKQVVDLADRIEDNGFYRVKADAEYSSKDFDVNTMGGLGYNALGHYTSLTGSDYMTAIKRMGYTSYWMEVGNSGGTALTDALLSVKYTVSDDENKVATAVYQNSTYSITKTPYFLPLGIVAKEDIIRLEQSAVYGGRAQYQQRLAAEVLGNADIVKIYTVEQSALTNVEVEKVDFGYSLKPSSSVGQMRFNVSQGGSYLLYFNVFYANNNSLRQPINECFTVSAPQRSYYSFPSQKRNGVAYAGKYSGNSYVNVRVNKAITVSELSAFTIDVAALEQAIGNASAIGITEGRGGFSGSIVANGGECVFLSLPYDSGMRLKINGKSAELYKVYDGFTAFYLEEGVNEIFISFTPRGFGAGLSLCIMGIAIIIAYCALKKRMAFSEGFVAIFEKVAFIAVLTAGIATIFIVYVAPIVLCVL